MFKNQIQVVLLTCTIFMMAGCSTPYQPYSYFGGGGYKEVQLGEDTFKITVEANAYTSESKASDIALLRAAELTKQYGFKYFIIGNTSDYSYSTSYTSPKTTDLFIASNGYSAMGTAETYGGQTYNFFFPSPSITITCFKNKPKFKSTVYTADIVYKSLKPQL